MENYISNLSKICLEDKISVLLNLLKQTAKGIQHLHNNEIIHRDIKASNILLFESSQNKIIAKLGGLQYIVVRFNLKAACNSPIACENTARECYDTETSRAVWNISTDIFALGIVFYYSLTQKCHPFAPKPKQNDIIKAKENIQNSVLPEFIKLREVKNCEEVNKIAMVDLIKGMTRNESTERLTIEEVLFHPAFYNSQEKLDFLLTFHANVSTCIKSWENRKNSLKKLRKEGTEKR